MRALPPQPFERRGAVQKIADHLGVTHGYVSNILSGRRRPSRDMAVKWEYYFLRTGVPITRWDLLYGRAKGESLSDYINRRDAAIRKKELEAYGRG